MVRKRIMLVEDEAVTAMDLKANLLQSGYEVPAVTASGEEAIRSAAEVRPDLILMDITLEGPMNGIQAADTIRKTNDIPIIFLTAHADGETIGRAKLTEPFGYLPKPSTLETLISTIEVALYKSDADKQRRKAEARLKWVMDEQKIILDNIGVGVLFTIYRRIIWTNKSISSMMGYSPEELAGKDTELFYAEKATYDKIGREGYATIDRGEPFTEEIQIKRKNGSVFWGHIVAQAVTPSNPEDGIIWVLEDVSDRKRWEEALYKSEEKYRTVANFTYDWELWIGPDESIIYTSPSCEKVTGYTAAAFTQDHSLLQKIIHPDDAAIYKDHRHTAKDHENSGQLEFRILHANGSIRWISHGCQPVYDARGAFLGTRGSNRDITERKSAEQEREHLISDLKGALAKVKALSGMLPVCASCKKIRDDKGYWQQIEEYISEHSEAEFSHGICPDCAKKLYGEYYKEEK